MPKPDPTMIFAFIAVLFALVNLVLWLQAWRNMNMASRSTASGGETDALIKELGARLDEVIEKNRRLEDQLWGVIDSLKEMNVAEAGKLLESIRAEKNSINEALKEVLESTRFIKSAAQDGMSAFKVIEEEQGRDAEDDKEKEE